MSLRKLFEPKNIVPVLAVALAFLGAILPEVSSIQIKPLPVILLVLGLLGIDAFVERIGYLKKIEENVSALSCALPKSRILIRRDFRAQTPFDQLVLKSKSMLVLGTSLIGIVGPFRNTLVEALKQGTAVKVLLLDPNLSDQTLDHVGTVENIPVADLKVDINATLQQLRRLRGELDAGLNRLLEVRLLQVFPCMSMLARDAQSEKGEILFEFHLYAVGPEERLVFGSSPPMAPSTRSIGTQRKSCGTIPRSGRHRLEGNGCAR